MTPASPTPAPTMSGPTTSKPVRPAPRRVPPSPRLAPVPAGHWGTVPGAVLRRLRPALRRGVPPPLRAALLAGFALAGLAAIPSRGADATLGSVVDPGPAVAAPWRLRQAVADAPAAPGKPVYGAPRGGPAGPIPEARRRVRLVYPALTEAR